MPRDKETAKIDAERRLRQELGRQPTPREVADLRLAEEALGLGQIPFVKARELTAQSKSLRTQSLKLTAKQREIREITRSTRKQSRRLRRKKL